MPKRNILFVGLLLCSLVVWSAVEVLAAQAAVTNNGTQPVGLNIKLADGSRSFETIQPGQTFNVPEGVTKVGFLSEGDVTITKLDGTTQSFKGTRPPTVSLEAQTQPVVRNNDTTIVLPAVSGTLMNPVIANLNMGIGLGAIASDAPVIYPANPLGISGEKLDAVLDAIDEADTDSDLNEIQDYFGLTNMQMAEALAIYDMEMWDYYSGSGGTFGDCVGTGCMIGVNFPGYPAGGLPYGRWTQFGPSRTVIATDSNLLSFFAQGGFSDSAFRSQFRDIYGADPVPTTEMPY